MRGNGSGPTEMLSDHEWNLTIVPDIGALSDAAADVVAETIRGKPGAVITLPTGATPLHLFDVLAARAARGEIDFSQVVFFSLDDYLGLSGTEPNSLTSWLRAEFLDRVNLHEERTYLVPAGAAEPTAAAIAYDREITNKGGFDLAVLGIGANGHIAFNEPGSRVDSRTRVVNLTTQTVSQAAAYWPDALPVPDRAMTVGIANLLEARRIVLLASGTAKAEALRQALEEPVSSENPASFLRLAGPRLEIIADIDAASRLSRAPAITR
jgi:glucosamine-6-phosphate deaminase